MVVMDRCVFEGWDCDGLKFRVLHIAKLKVKERFRWRRIRREEGWDDGSGDDDDANAKTRLVEDPSEPDRQNGSAELAHTVVSLIGRLPPDLGDTLAIAWEYTSETEDPGHSECIQRVMAKSGVSKPTARKRLREVGERLKRALRGDGCCNGDQDQTRSAMPEIECRV